ncbi:NAD-dependent deacetylase [bacterium]|nr:NAD-dependent deacetylase [bacterium]
MIDHLDSFNKLLITAGAGMGVDSGLPDFRGDKGFWRAYPALKSKNLSFVEMANPIAFVNYPHLAWGFYGHRLQLYRDTLPHKGFLELLNLSQKMDDYFVVSSNVDGHFQKSGFSDQSIYEVHGSIHYLQCTRCSKYPFFNDIKFSVDLKTLESKSLPRCDCGSILRPNILMFGDYAWNDMIFYQQETRYGQFLSNIKLDDKLLIIELGAGLTVPTIQMQSNSINSRYQNSYLVRINPNDYQIYGDRASSIPMGSIEGLSNLFQKSLV